jgi:hypothetical protein
MDHKELAERLGPPEEQHVRFEGESHYLLFHGWRVVRHAHRTSETALSVRSALFSQESGLSQWSPETRR